MPRIQFSDVTPPERRSIRDVPIPNSGKRKVLINVKPKEQAPRAEEPQFYDTPVQETRSRMTEVTEERPVGNYEYYYPKEKKTSDRYGSNSGKSRKKQWLYGAIAAIAIGIFIVCMMTVFASATVEITPKSQDLNVDMKISASTEARTGGVRYEMVKLAETKSVSVPATGEEAVELKASGKIVIYNNFSTDPQRLIIRTRFATPDGLIYRIPESVVVPGKSVKDGVSTPGSIEVTVFADEAGDKYNIKKTDFTIPGFKNDADRYKNFYARSSTNMEGGFIGKRKTVSETDKIAALQNIDSEVQTDLEKNLRGKVPEGLVLLTNSMKYEVTEVPPVDEGSSVILGKEVTAYAVMLNAQDLSNVITGEYISKLPEWNNIKSIINNFSLLAASDLSGNYQSGGEMSLQIKGKTKVWANIDTNSINQKLIGIPKKDVAELMNEFAGIISIKSTIRPVWKQTFPKDSFRIHVKTVTNE